MTRTIPLALAACAPDPPEQRPAPVDTAPAADTAPPPVTDGCGGAFCGGPVMLRGVDLTCKGDVVRWLAETTGWTSAGDVYLLETGAEEPRGDDLLLASVAYEPCGAWDQLAQELAHVADDVEPTPDETTWFDCADWEAEQLTLVATVFDLNGAVADCAVIGHDPIGLVEGDYAEWIAWHHARDWSACIVLNQLGIAR